MDKLENYVTGHIVDFLIRKEIVIEDEKDVYIYCVNSVMETMFFLFVVLLIAVISKKVPETAIFSCYFFIFRSNAGGFHAKTFHRCYCLSMTMYLLSLFIADVIGNTNGIPWFLVATVAITILAPVGSINKPIENNSHTKMVVKTRILLFSLLFGILYVVLYHYKIGSCQMIVVSSYMVFFFQICGIINNKNKRKEMLEK